MKLDKKILFQVFKYAVYTAVFLNVLFFLNKEIAAGAHRYAEGMTFDNFIEMFTSTIDTAAWVILLLLFELETYLIPDEKLKGSLLWVLRVIRGLCYVVIVYSFVGYCQNFLWLMKFHIIEFQKTCELVGYSWMIELDEFKEILKVNCEGLAKGTEILQFKGKDIYTDNLFYNEAIWLGVTDIVNSLTWILVVVVLEIDVWLQLKNQFKGWVLKMSKYIKNVLYAILFLAAVYWGIYGDLLEFWDAFLWIVAFVFIEMNLFEWKKEVDMELLKTKPK